MRLKAGAGSDINKQPDHFPSQPHRQGDGEREARGHEARINDISKYHGASRLQHNDS